jgi:hypothetical protein
LEIDGGVWSASRPGRITLAERALVSHWIGDCAPESIWMQCRAEKCNPCCA